MYMYMHVMYLYMYMHVHVMMYVLLSACFAQVQIKSFRDYVDLFLKAIPPSEDEDDLPQRVVYEALNPRWEVAVTVSPAGFQQASFVNSIATTKVL